MNERELYKKTFSNLCLSESFNVSTERRRKRSLRIRPVILAAVAAMLIIGSATVAFADELAQRYRDLRVMIGLVEHSEGEICARLGDEDMTALEKDVYAVEYLGVEELETVYKLSDTEAVHVLPFDIHDALDDELAAFGLVRKEGLNYKAAVTQNGGKLFAVMVESTDENGAESGGYAIHPTDITVTADGRVIYSYFDRYTGPDGDEVREENCIDLTDSFNGDGYARHDFEVITLRRYRDGTLIETETESRSLRVYRGSDGFYGIICNNINTPEFQF